MQNGRHENITYGFPLQLNVIRTNLSPLSSLELISVSTSLASASSRTKKAYESTA